VSRDGMQTTRFAMHPGLMHSEDNLSPEALYYGFVLRFVETVLASNQTDQVITATDLAILVAKEILCSQRASIELAVPVLRQIWEHPQHGLLMRENRRLVLLVIHIVNVGLPQLDSNEAFLSLFTSIFPHSASTMAGNHRDAIIRSLCDKIRYSMLYINQAIHHPQENSSQYFDRWIVSLVQSLRALLIVLTDQDIHRQFMAEYSQMIGHVNELASLAESNTSPLKGVNRVSDLVRMAASLPK